ncbi:tyrosine-type recombinase/integrase [Amycolatopsis sp. NPDC049253]|uniref:tyrosine-type recombinase/integrase n=1 Tax=Amycolatopsis sp. NPDC049253 TaxID=3155274 RepID=UPI003446BCD6
MPSTEKLPSGRYRGLYRDADGAKQRVPGTFDRKSDAKDAAVEAEGKAKRQAAASKGTLSARTPWGEWWEIFSADRSFDSDHAINVRNNVNKHVLPKWENIALNAITRFGEDAGVQDWVDDLVRRGYKPSYVRNIVQPFTASINAAVERRVLTASPCAGLKLPRLTKGAKPYVSEAHRDKIAPKMGAVYADAVDFMLETGIRPGELAGLHANRVDLDGRWMLVKDVYLYRRKLIRPKPKDGEDREIPLSARAVNILRRRLDGRDLVGGCGFEHIGGAQCTSVLVFLTPDNRVVRQNQITRQMQKAAAALKVDSRSGYASRRGFATRAIDGGADVFAVKAIMGHADLEELAGYVQRTPEARAKLLAALGERAELKSVPDVGPRGTDRGTNPDNQALPSTPTEDTANAS